VRLIIAYCISQPRLSSFAQRIAVNFYLSPLAQSETKDYIAFRLKKAGGKPRIFEPEALDMICQASCVIPRSINLLCDAALVYGFGYELKTIGVPVIEQVIKDKGGLGLDITIGGVEESLRAEAVEETDPVLIERFKALETTVQKLHLQMEWKIEQLKRQSNGFKDDLVAKMQRLLTNERRRSDLLLTRYARLREKCKPWKKELP
jgi:general secretion pathway protein A